MKPSGVGGQAVIEGVMMKNKEQYAVAVRKPNNEIVVEKNTFISAAEKYKIFKFPIFRGMLAFAESMIIGTRTLTFSASFFEEEEEVKPSKMDQAFSKIFKEKAESVIMGITFFIAILLAVGIFIVLPAFAANLLGTMIESETVIAIVEGIIRILIFIAYIAAISQMKDIKRMFMYHGAEHKTINCLEHGFELTVKNVKRQSKEHKRCGTSFMFIVMFVSIIFFIFIRVEQEWLRYLIRVLLIPIIAGVSYEFIRFAGKSDSKIVNILSKPGMWLQGLTTREPDDAMIEVAIQSVEAVFDWREFLGMGSASEEKDETNIKKNSGKNHSQNNKTQDNKQNKVPSSKKQNKTVNSDINKKKNNQSNNQSSKRNSIEENDLKSDKADKKKINAADSSKTKETSLDKEIKQAVEETAVTAQKAIKAPIHPAFEEEEDEILRALDRYLVSKEEED
ncbi:DUF1385 domain-containing protein [Anaerocolumna sedimenticola]|uniref:DUF1385 domain-containing protein n=1 Tax=Anaerocolumna sedimenticola TaxID=2696063 RepID=A0A6P1TJS8_9FIRM|nr:DUF1385 domain-containing protein [Anaerocolumna sedimenticola]QHQ59885.1 DUF1385 domain-containing protein [Anaerocolumna sedimenticola]